MATSLFLQGPLSETQPSDIPTPTPGPIRHSAGTGDSSNDGVLTTGRGTGVTTSGAQQTDVGPLTVDLGYYISDPLAAAVTISGTITFNFWMFESAMAVNAGAAGSVYRIDCTTNTKTALVTDSAKGSELGTSAAVQNWTATPTSTAFNKGDRILVYCSAKDAGGTMAAGTVTLNGSGTTSGANGDSFVSFTEALTFSTATPAGTKLYPTDAASDISTADDDRVLGLAQGSSAVTVSRATGTPPISAVQMQRSGTNVRWYSGQLSAGTVQGPILVNLHGSCSPLNSDFTFTLALIWRTAGGTETQVAYGVYPIFGAVNSPANTAERTMQFILGVSDFTISDGDRLAVIVYADDSGETNASSSTTMTMYYAGAAGATGDTYIRLTSTVTSFTPASMVPNFDPYPQFLAQ